MRKNLYLLLLIAALSYPALAEGTLNRTPGEYGINRRVNTETTGYIGVQGTFHASIAEAPPLVRLSKEEEKAHPLENANHYKSTPTCYLGSHLSGKVSKQVDAGLQYYTDTPVYPNHDKLHPGWGAFINYNRITPTPKKAKTGPNGLFWEGYRDSWTAQSNVDYKLQYKVNTTDHEGFVVLNVNGGALSSIPEFTWSNKDLKVYLPTSDGQQFPTFNDGNRVYLDSDSLNTLAVKRVLGMTQGNVTTYELDGSAMTGTFKEGQVFKIGGSWVDWPYDIVAQDETGYDVDQNAKDAKWGGKDGEDTIFSQYILTFPNIQAYSGNGFNLDAPAAQDAARKPDTSANPSKYLQENNTSRYTQETVKISLRSATKMTGEKSNPRSAGS